MASEYLKWKYRDVRPEVPRELTPKERRANWWHYHKWHVAAVIALLLVLGDLGLHAWNAGRNAPDYQVAYVADAPLPEEAAAALEEALSGLAGGKVKVNQYLTGQTGDAALYASAASVQLMADLETFESFLFLLDDPETFQTNYEVLRNLDGTLPDNVPGKPFCLRWSECPVLAALPLGTYSETVLGQELTGDSQPLFSGLYLARRGFWGERTCKNPEGCERLWAILTEGALS